MFHFSKYRESMLKTGFQKKVRADSGNLEKEWFVDGARRAHIPWAVLTRVVGIRRE